VMVNGPRQCGKTTMVREFASTNRAYITLDDDTVLESVRNDPTGFVRGLNMAIVDEVQRAPELLRAIKKSVDADRRPGRFLLTGSANVLALPQVSESLAGRMEIITLLPLGRSETLSKRPTFLENALAGKIVKPFQIIIGDDLVGAVLVGGYPEMLRRKDQKRRRVWARDYFSQLGGQIGLDDKTARKYIAILEQLFLVHRVEPWFHNRLKRLVKTPKLHFIDSGLLAVTIGATEERVAKDRSIFGPLLETFLFSEVMKQVSWLDESCTLHYYRDKDQDEVDIVVESESGAIVGLEIKAAATVNAGDFRGLRKLSEALGQNFKLGLVLYDSENTVPFGDNMFAAPISCLAG
jgi:predicted AAA+ superfamily ATPase